MVVDTIGHNKSNQLSTAVIISVSPYVPQKGDCTTAQAMHAAFRLIMHITKSRKSNVLFCFYCGKLFLCGLVCVHVRVVCMLGIVGVDALEERERESMRLSVRKKVRVMGLTLISVYKTTNGRLSSVPRVAVASSSRPSLPG